MRILILGGDGYLGWATSMYFSRRGHEVHAVDNYLRRRMHEDNGTDSLTPVLDSLPARAQAWKDVTGLEIGVTLLVGKVESLASPPTPEMQRERPYIMGPLELVPSVDGKFKKTEEFTFFFQVYNAQMENNKPDLTMEYAFYRQDGGAEKYFNKTNPQQFNAQTLPPAWDGSLGHVINGGQTIPLASFPEGEYRLEIKVTDNRATKSITRNVNFSVSGS